MYGNHGEGVHTRLRSVDTTDIGEILATYFPDNEFSIDDDKLMLTVDLIRFFSTSQELNIASQVRLTRVDIIHVSCFLSIANCTGYNCYGAGKG